MPVAVDIVQARELLIELIDLAEADSSLVPLDADIEGAISSVLASRTGAFRQALVGTILVKLLAPDANLALPSTEHGPAAYSGRTVDETVVMPLFGLRRIPISQASAYLSTLRRGKRFVDEDVVGTRDRQTYLAANAFVAWLQQATVTQAREAGIRLISGFLRLRDAQQIALIDLPRISHPQLVHIVTNLLARPSGGRWPMIVVVAALGALNEQFSLDWTVDAQGINAADSSRGAVGDITIRRSQNIVLGIEVTERHVDAARIRTAMTEKAMPKSVTDYLYLVTVAPSADAQAIARSYFGQGYDVNFLDIATWTANALGLTAELRQSFVKQLRAALTHSDTPASLKVAWNEVAASLV